MLTVSPGFSTCGFSPLKQMRPTPDEQKSVCPTGWECHAVRAPGVNVTTEPPRRGGAPPCVERPGANDPGFYCHDCAPSSGGLATAQIWEASIAVVPAAAQSKW